MIDVIVDVMVDGIDEVIGVMIGEVVIGVVIGEINAFQCSSGFLFHPLKAHECLCLEVVVVPVCVMWKITVHHDITIDT